MSVHIQTYRNSSTTDPFSDKVTVAATFQDFPYLMGSALANEVVHLLAERFVTENYASLVSKLDQQAIANLAVADSGKKIAEEIRRRPVVYPERGDTYTKLSIF